MTGRETEEELDKIFQELGYNSILTPKSNDEGIDHILDGNIVVQTKNQKNKTRRPELQQFWGSWRSSHSKGLFVSIHGFTKGCEKFVDQDKKPILLYDVNNVIEMSNGKKPKWKS